MIPDCFPAKELTYEKGLYRFAGIPDRDLFLSVFFSFR